MSSTHHVVGDISSPKHNTNCDIDVWLTSDPKPMFLTGVVFLVDEYNILLIAWDVRFCHFAKVGDIRWGSGLY
eukprot:m.361598 g.361598  ORF g.361598 m.361598 type:complete len:73 (+) comp19709_c0_seq1:88-306(+)